MTFAFPLASRALLVLLHDLLAVALAWIGAHWLSNDLAWPPGSLRNILLPLAWLVPLQGMVFYTFGLYQGIWRFASLPDLKRILRAIALASLVAPLMSLFSAAGGQTPRTVMLLQPVLLLLIMGGSRLLYRAWKEHRLTGLSQPEAKPVLVLGAGSPADMLLRELARNPSGYRVVGLLDDNPAKIGRRLQDIPILGSLRDVGLWAQRMGVSDVILALPSVSHKVRKRLTDLCSQSGLRVLTVPSLEDLLQGRVSVSTLRPVELEDLLGRDPVVLDDAGLYQCLHDRVVLVTGAGGSIGSELCRQIARFRPARLVLYEQSEYALYSIEQELTAQYPEQSIASLIGDVKDRARVRQVLGVYRPAVVFHAAAYKHVPLMECNNALEALKNNTLGTWVLAQAALEAGVEKFVLISTDKAVNPTNVMGASKRLAEMVCQALQPGSSTRFISVRFGNVLGSSGSVIPKFRQQIEAGGPVTVTHPEITRYFMTIPEAAQLVLQAGLMGQGGEIFVLDMGEPVKIVDLARLMIRLAGKDESQIPIVFTGLRPGEKLYEEVLADHEQTLATPHPKLRVAMPRSVSMSVIRSAVAWISGTQEATDEQVRQQLRLWVPEYRPSGDGSSSMGALAPVDRLQTLPEQPAYVSAH